MKRSTLIAGLTLLAAGGCAAPQSEDSATAPLALTQFRPVDDVQYDGSGVFHLGAGDMLGREIFVNYLVYLHADQDRFYATGENPDDPADD